MGGNPLKVVFFAFFMCLAILACTKTSFAQDASSAGGDDNSADQQASADNTQATLNQLHELESRMQDTGRKLDALEKAVNHAVASSDEASDEQTASTQEVPVEQAPVEEAPAQVAAPVQEAPVQMASSQIIPYETHDIIPQAPIYYEPMTSFPKEHTFEVSQEDFYSSFKEKGNYEVYKKSGAFFGLNSAYTFRPLNSEDWWINVYHMDVHGDFGLMDYNYEGDKINDVDDYIIEPRVWFGKTFDVDSLASLTPYIGVGYRWYYDQLRNKTDDDLDGGFNIQTQYVYIPVGAQLSFHPAAGWRIDMNSEYDSLVWGRVTNYLSDNDFGTSGLSNIANTYKHGYGIRGSIKFIKEEDSVNYFFEPYIRYWNIKESDTQQILYYGMPISPYQEDKNNTTEVGARVGLEF